MGANRIIILVAISLITIAVYSSASAKEIIAASNSEANFCTSITSGYIPLSVQFIDHWQNANPRS